MISFHKFTVSVSLANLSNSIRPLATQTDKQTYQLSCTVRVCPCLGLPYEPPRWYEATLSATKKYVSIQNYNYEPVLCQPPKFKQELSSSDSSAIGIKELI